MDEGNRARARMLKRITADLAFQRNAKVKFKWPNFHLFQFFDCHPGFYLWALILSIRLKRKTWPQEDCYWESVFADGRSHICSEEPEVCILLSRERTDFGSWATVKTRAERLFAAWFRATQQTSYQVPFSHSQENKHEWYKNTREGGFE